MKIAWSARRYGVGKARGYGWVIGEPNMIRLQPEDRHIWPQQLEFTLRELGVSPMDVYPFPERDRDVFESDLRPDVSPGH